MLCLSGKALDKARFSGEGASKKQVRAMLRSLADIVARYDPTSVRIDGRVFL